MAVANTDIDICNLALGKIGARKIATFSDNTQSAELCNRFYDILRQAELRRNGWKFAINRMLLPAFTVVSDATWPSGYNLSQAWDSGTSYVIDSVVVYPANNPVIYKSLVGPNLNIVPGTDAASWEQQAAVAAIFDYDYQYLLPSDFLRLLPQSPKESELPKDWLVEQGKILTSDNAPLQIRYVQDFTNVQKMESMFIMGLACRIAAEIVFDLKQSTGGKADLLAEYDKYMNEARRINAIEEGPTEAEIDSWEAIRL